MRKRWMAWTVWGVALAALALTGGVADRAAAQSSQRAWLGVSTQEITDDLRDGLSYRGPGVLVSRVVSDSPADRAGLEKGDVLVSFNSRTIDTPEELTDVVRAARVGQSVSLTIMRDGQRRNLTAKLASWPEDESGMNDTPAPAPVPRAPRAPRAPTAPRAYRFNWNGEDFDMPGGGVMALLGRGRLGVQIQDLNDDLGDALGVPNGKGVLVTSVTDDSPASKAGIKGGDVIVEVGGRAVDDTDDLRRELAKHEGRVSVTLLRRGARRTVEPELAARPRTSWYESDGTGDRRTIRVPDVRIRRDLGDEDSNRADLEAQMKELREELRELRKQLEETKKP